MARIFVDGFEGGGIGCWIGPTSFSTGAYGIVTSPPAGMTGQYYLNCSSSGDYVYYIFPAVKAELYFAFKYFQSGGRTVVTFYDSAGTAIGALARNNTTGYLEFKLGTYAGTLIATGTTNILANTTYLIELRYKPLNAGGIFQVKVNGNAAEIDYSGDTTAGLEGIYLFMLGWNATVGGNANRYDDIVVDDASWIGNTRITAIAPTGAGATGDFDCEIDSLVSAPANTSTTLQNCRTVLSATDLAHSGTKIRLRLRMQGMGGPTINGCSIGERSGSTDDFNGAPTRVTFDNGSNTRITTTSELVVSDLINFTLDETKDYLVHLYFSVYQAWVAVSSALPTTRQSYTSTGSSDDTLTESVAYSSSAGNHFFVEAISVVKTDGASNYLTVDETPASGYDYTFTNTANAIDTYAMGAPSSSIGSIKSVSVQTRNWRTGNGAVGMLKHVVRPVSTDRVGATVNGGAYIPISATVFQTIWELNPEDSAAWEIADVEGMEAGVKAVTA